MKKLLLVVSATSLLLFPGVAGAGGSRDTARGHGTNFNGLPFSFRATSNYNGTDARGSATLNFSSVTIYGEVTCLRVVGGAASIGGRVTRIEPPSVANSALTSFVIQASDAGRGSTTPDTASYGVSTSPAPSEGGCAAPTPGSPITTGEVVIDDSNG